MHILYPCAFYLWPHCYIDFVRLLRNNKCMNEWTMYPSHPKIERGRGSVLLCLLNLIVRCANDVQCVGKVVKICSFTLPSPPPGCSSLTKTKVLLLETFRCCVNAKFHLARQVTRLDTTRHVRRVERARRAFRACRAVLFQHGGRRTSYSACLYKFSRFYALTYTNPICSVKWTKLNKYIL